MQEYKASIRYDEGTVARLDRAISDSFFFSRRLCFYGICIALIAGGAFMGITTSAGMIALLMGCLLLPSASSVKSRNARQVVRAIKGRSLKMEYSFYEKEFVCSISSGDTTHNPYSSVIRLVEEKDYLYLFQKPTQACMVDVSTLSPAGTAEFKEFLSRKVGLQWTTPLSLFSLSLRKVRFNRENTRSMRK